MRHDDSPLGCTIIHGIGLASGIGAVCATEYPVADLYAVTNDAARAVIARGSDRLNRTLETVERVSLPIDVDLETLVVLIATKFAGSHHNLLG
jgi:hypothetical protein